MASVDAAWTAADLAKAVCDQLVAKGLLREKPAFIRSLATCDSRALRCSARWPRDSQTLHVGSV